MADSYPRQNARTRRFTLGVPRSFRVSGDGRSVVFLRSRHGTDPVTCLWVLDTGSGAERLIADPRELAGGSGELDPVERARRERAREQAGGITGYATDAAAAAAVFSLAGRVYLASLAGPGGVRELAVTGVAADPRLSPSGDLVSYVSDGALRVLGVADGLDQAVAGPEPGGAVTFGLAEFIAAEEMDRFRGYWWSPDSTALLAARVDESPVTRWHIADPANPGRPPATVRYPAAGTANADVSLVIAAAHGDRPPAPVRWDTAAFPYLVTACWDAGGAPLAVVQSRDQRRTLMLEIDTAGGATSVLRSDEAQPWLEIVPGVPARTAAGRIVWTAPDAATDTRRLLVASPEQLADGSAAAVTPPGLQVREVCDVDGDTVLFTASGADPTSVELWCHGPGGLHPAAPGSGPAVRTGRRAGGTTLLADRSLRRDGAEFTVFTADPVTGSPGMRIAAHAEQPLLPPPRPDIFPAGDRQVRTAILLPSWHEPGSGTLPVLMNPYGGPHAQMVTSRRAAYYESQWFAEQGFAVVVADGRGTPGRGLAFERAIAGDLATPPLEDQAAALAAAAARCPDLDTSRVGIRGWSFGGYLSALAVLRAPEVFHAAVAGAPVTDWRLYDTHYTERYLGQPEPDGEPGAYAGSSLLAGAARLARPLLLIHGLADDNVVVAHTLRLSAALLAAGRPHTVLPLPGVTHMAAPEVAENLLLLQVDFLRRSLASPA